MRSSANSIQHNPHYVIEGELCENFQKRNGEYIDPSVFGGSGEPYYRANAREAIAKAGYVGTVDEVSYKLASLVRNSPNHWNHIGSLEYTYIAVGVTCESDMWYCAIEITTSPE